MKLVMIFGPQAVGKMTVGQELGKITDLKLIHNHMTIDLLHPFFGFGEDTWRISDIIREEIFIGMIRSGQPGLIFTYVWAFNKQEDWDFVDKVRDLYESNGGKVYFVELEANIEERLKRNVTPNRLTHKPTKRNIEESEHNLRGSMDKYRLNSFDGEIKYDHYLRINNTQLDAETVASMIKEYFKL